MTKNINEMGLAMQPTMYYYRLNPACDKGKEFMSVVGEGVQVEKKANKLVKECNAVGCVPSLYADFGGVTALAFKNNVKPDPEVFLDSEQSSPDGHRLYEPHVRCEQKVCVWEKMPADHPDIIKSKRELLAGEVLANFPRKMLAEALGMELKYMHPLEALRLLNIPAEEASEFARGKKTMKEVLAGKMFVSKRDKANSEYAIKGEQENMVFVEELKKHTYGLYTVLHGTDKAKLLFCECQALPVVPHGTLNAVVGLDKARNRCGFFIHKNWIWVKSGAKSTMELNDDWQEVAEEEWMKNCGEARELYQGKGKSEKENRNDDITS